MKAGLMFLGRSKIFLVCILVALGLLLPGCSSNPLAPAATATPTPAPPTDTPAPSPTPLPPTPTFTPAPTKTPAASFGDIASDPTPTWTPVPGNPRWSIWSYQNLVFLLPVAWQKAPDDATMGSLYKAPGGGEQPQLLITLEDVPADVGISDFAEAKIDFVQSDLENFDLLDSGAFDLAGVEGQRYIYAATLTTGDILRNVRVVSFYAMKDGMGISLRFTVDEKVFEQWPAVFDQIAGSVEFQ